MLRMLKIRKYKRLRRKGPSTELADDEYCLPLSSVSLKQRQEAAEQYTRRGELRCRPAESDEACYSRNISFQSSFLSKELDEMIEKGCSLAVKLRLPRIWDVVMGPFYGGNPWWAEGKRVNPGSNPYLQSL